MTRSDLIHSEMSHLRQGGDSSSRSSTLRRGDITTRAEISHRPDSLHRLEVTRRSDIIPHRTDAYQWAEAPHRQDASHRTEVPLCPDGGHFSDVSHLADIGHRSDMLGVENGPRAELNLHPEVHQNDGTRRPEIPHRMDGTHHLNSPHSHTQVELNERSTPRPDPHLRLEFPHRDLSHRDSIWRQDVGDLSGYQRGDERRLPSVPLPENSHSLPSHHSHGVHHHAVHNISQPHHSHSYGRHQAAVPLPETAVPISAQDVDQKERKGGPSKIVIPQLPNIPKSGTGVYEDTFHVTTAEGSHLHTATLRRGKHTSIGSNGMGTLR